MSGDAFMTACLVALPLGSAAFVCWAAWMLFRVRRFERDRDAKERAELRRQLASSARYPREPR